MMQEIATFDAVLAAYEALRERGDTPTANAVLKYLGGGSKSTIVKHLQTLRQQQTTEQRSNDPAASFLESVSRPLIQKIWKTAQEQAKAHYEIQIRTLLRVHSEMEQEIQQLQASEEQALQLVRSAEAELKATQNAFEELRIATGQSEDVHRILSRLHEQALRLFPGPGGRVSAMDMAIQFIDGGKGKLTRAELINQMLGAGFTKDEAHKARFHAIQSEYAEEGVDEDKTVLLLTTSGRERLEKSAEE